MASSIAAAVAATAMLAAPAAAPQDARFTVYRDGSPIGTHRIQVERAGDETRVAVDIDLQVKLAFVTVYRYSHRNRETWRDGRLVAIDTRTDDNGTAEFVRGRATGDGFAVQSTAGSYTVPAGVLPTSYWRRITPDQTRLLDTQKGRLLDVQVRRAGVERLPGTDSATRYTVRGDLDLDLWYDTTDRLRRIAFDFRGSRFDYSEAGQRPSVAAR